MTAVDDNIRRATAAARQHQAQTIKVRMAVRDDVTRDISRRVAEKQVGDTSKVNDAKDPTKTPAAREAAGKPSNQLNVVDSRGRVHLGRGMTEAQRNTIKATVAAETVKVRAEQGQHVRNEAALRAAGLKVQGATTPAEMKQAVAKQHTAGLRLAGSGVELRGQAIKAGGVGAQVGATPGAAGLTAPLATATGQARGNEVAGRQSGDVVHALAADRVDEVNQADAEFEQTPNHGVLQSWNTQLTAAEQEAALIEEVIKAAGGVATTAISPVVAIANEAGSRGLDMIFEAPPSVS